MHERIESEDNCDWQEKGVMKKKSNRIVCLEFNNELDVWKEQSNKQMNNNNRING